MWRRGVPHALVTLVHSGEGLQNPPSRKVGARMWVAEDGHILGSVGFGSCVDQAARKQALEALWQQTPFLYRHHMENLTLEGSLSCTGNLTLWIEPVSGLFPCWKQAQNLLEQRTSCVLITRTHSTEHALTTNLKACPGRTHWDGQLFMERWDPPIRLLIAGENDVAQHLFALARMMDHQVEFFDPALHDPSSLDAFSALVITSHQYDQEVELLSQALKGPAGYLAVLSSASRAERLREYLQDLGVQDTERIYGPAGWDLGVSSSKAIALGILAELTAKIHTAAYRTENLEMARW
ncbi:xanthine dehydrogenase [Deinococcus cellulosilyticus NBRC 106333 = KACC 11606]|uniref:Xanthine dehydrogenase n=2 Tax=Deinococcus cellulosilyticus TaxID=401558 RepID=A0A511N9M3_DEIC1|nr:xanthine dehydrogenase [Deinococcus cellulosilyticus NBRC 106333 = KACC 11606]